MRYLLPDYYCALELAWKGGISLVRFTGSLSDLVKPYKPCRSFTGPLGNPTYISKAYIETYLKRITLSLEVRLNLVVLFN